MKEYSTERIRNIGVVSHGDVGKTSLVEAMLYSAGETTRLGKVDDGTTITDYTQEEIDRKITISTALANIMWKNHKFNLIDTPGYTDFVGEVICALQVADIALILLNGITGVEVGTESMWSIAQEHQLPVFLFINRLNKEHANFDQVLNMVRDRFGAAAIPLQFPVNQGESFNAIIDLLKMKQLTFGDLNGKYTESEIPAALLEQAQELRKQLEEAVAENDEALMEKYYAQEKLDEKDLLKGLRQEVSKRNIIPVLCGAATANIGTHRLLDALIDFGPSPIDRGEFKATKPGTTDTVVRHADNNEPFAAQVFKTVAELHIGELSFFRVYSGTLKSGMEVLNITHDATEKIGQIYFMNGKNRKEAEEMIAGDIGALVKLKNTHTGDTLCDKKHPLVFPSLKFPEPVINVAVAPRTKGDEERISAGLNSIHGEDPTFIVKYDPEVKQMLMHGQGEVQFDVAVKRLKDKFGVEVDLIEPRIPYRETIRKKVETQGKYKKQSGGRGQYGDCHLRLEPLPSGTGFEFSDEVVGGVIPGKYIPAIEKGVRETMVEGVLAGYNVVDVKVAVFYGSFHPVDSSDMAFKIAGSMAFKKAFMEAKPVLLEPIYDVEVKVPEECMGDVMGDLSSRRGKISGMDSEGPFQIIKAKVPLAELYKYSTSLRSLTQGRGLHRRTFSHYEDVPGEIQAKIVNAAQEAKNQ
ncbi:elongation factor G [candidate division KSB1 bacterium]|nr:elongation factor G [candidate division KSB1 bacterium]